MDGQSAIIPSLGGLTFENLFRDGIQSIEKFYNVIMLYIEKHYSNVVLETL